MTEKYILEVRYLDKVNRCRKTSIVGVYLNQEKIELAKNEILSQESRFKPTFSIQTVYDLF